MVKEATISEGYKQTEAGVIPVDWEVKSIDDICMPNGLIRGPFGGALKKEFFVKNGYKVYEQKNAIYQTTVLGNYYIATRKYDELKRFAISEGDFIVSCSGTIGKVYQIPKNFEPGVINQALLKVKINEKILISKFFFYLFSWSRFQEKIIDNTQGGAMQNLVGMDTFKKTTLLIPTLLPEQKAIATALSNVDALIASLDKLITKKQNIKQGTMQQLLTGKKRLPGFSGEWKVKKLGEILKVRHGKSQRSVVDNNGEFPILATGGEIGKAKEYLYNKPSVLIGRKGTIDIPQYMDSPFWTIDTLFYTEISDNSYPKFVFYLFNMIDWYSYNEASGVPSLNASTIENIEQQLPPTKTEQQTEVVWKNWTVT